MSEQDIWHLLTASIFLLSLWQLRKGLIDSTSWFCVFFSISFSGNILGYPLAVLGDPVFVWIKDEPATNLYGQIVFVAMISTWMGHVFVRRILSSSTTFKNLPELSLSEFKLDKIFRFLALVGVLLSIVLTMTGYAGYYVSSGYLRNPPIWLEVVKALIAIASGFLFLVIVKEFQVKRILGIRSIALISIWIAAGLLSGFKTMVVMPGLFVLIGAWMAGRARGRHFMLLALLLVVAYSVVEPMREEKNQGNAQTAYQGISRVIGSDEFSIMEVSSIIDQFLQRIDYTRNAIITLIYYEQGRLNEFKRRVDEYFLFAPMMAFVPRAYWPSKPLSNLGGVLSYEITGNDRNSITPSQVVITYIWGGWLGVVSISLIWGMLCTVGGQIIIDNKSSIYRRAPFILLAIVLSRSSAVMASYFIFSARMIVVVSILYQLGVLRRIRLSVRHKAIKEIPGRAKY